MTLALRRIAVVLVTVWAIRSLVVTGGSVLNERFRAVLTTPPAVTQASTDGSFAQSLIKIDRSLPKHDRVVVFWSQPQPDYYAAYFWSTFFLFPRKVTLATDIGAGLTAASDSIVTVRGPNMSQLDVPDFQVTDVDTYPDLTVTIYRRTHG